MNRLNEVLFVGAGPGDPELITVKGQNALKNADIIIYAGSLVPEAVLMWAKETTEKRSSADMDLDEIIRVISSWYEKGKRVVRLHTGDPSLYGAIMEQMSRLDELDIPYTVIPGVTAAFAAAGAMKMEYTLPEITQTLILTRIAGRTPVPETENLESLAAHKASMAIYLSISLIEKVQTIIETHYGKNALCGLAYKISHPEEKIIYTPAAELAETCKKNDITRHALIIVGKAVEVCVKKHGVTPSKLYDSTFSHGYRKSK